MFPLVSFQQNDHLVKQILPPLIVALREEPHQMPARMQTKRPRSASQFHARLLRSPTTLLVVARMAARDEILPSRFPRARPRDYVVERQFARRHRPVAILAYELVAHQDILPRQRPRLMWNPPVVEQPDHARDPEGATGRAHFDRRMLLRRRDALQDKDNRTPDRAHVDRLEARVQDKDRSSQSFCTGHSINFPRS